VKTFEISHIVAQFGQDDAIIPKAQNAFLTLNNFMNFLLIFEIRFYF
tara:strand:+ start:2272 stop:2412 length:141 start_codon:yes stop_codon:yes gene_type:complete